MEKNKSIDGLSTHDAKKTARKAAKAKSAPTKSTRKPVKKPAKQPIAETTPEAAPITTPVVQPAAPSTPESVADSIIPEDAIAIEVVEDAAAKIEPETKVQQTREEAVEDFLNPVEAFNFGDDEEDAVLTTEEATDNTTTTDTTTDNTINTEADTTKPMTKEDKSTLKKELKEAKKATKEEAKKTKKSHKVRNIIASILLCLVLIASGVIVWAVFWGNDIIAKITGGQGNVFDLFTLANETYDPLKTDSNGRTNILAFGTSGYDMSGDEGDGVAHAGAQLTDSIMMISINQETGDIAMLSLPRDLKASPTCTATGKINEVYWCSNMHGDDEAAGAAALMEEVGSILGVNFQYYAHLNWGSLVNIVDILGGITITLDEDIEDYYWTGAVFQAGVPYTINGEQALGLARARHGTMGGDFSRGASQQKILIGIKDKIFEKSLSLTDIIGLASTLGDNLRTNFSLSELKTAAHLTFEFDLESMRQISLYNPAEGIRYMTTGTLDNGISYVFPSAGVGNYGDIQEYVAENLSNDPRTYENPTIAIYNASETTGLAASEQKTLEKDGFTITHIDNAPEGEYDENTTLYIINDKPGTKALLSNHYANIKTAEDLPSTIAKDYDFIIILNQKSEE